MECSLKMPPLNEQLKVKKKIMEMLEAGMKRSQRRINTCIVW